MLGFKKRPIEDSNLTLEEVVTLSESQKGHAKPLQEDKATDAPKMKHRNTCQTDLLEELSQQLSQFSLNSNNANAIISPHQIVGQFYQKVAQLGSLGTLKKMDQIARDKAVKDLNAHKGWALGMAVAEKNSPVVMHILNYPGDMLHLGHVKYAIDKANETQQADIVHILEEFKQNLILREAAQRRVIC